MGESDNTTNREASGVNGAAPFGFSWPSLFFVAMWVFFCCLYMKTSPETMAERLVKDTSWEPIIHGEMRVALFAIWNLMGWGIIGFAEFQRGMMLFGCREFLYDKSRKTRIPRRAFFRGLASSMLAYVLITLPVVANVFYDCYAKGETVFSAEGCHLVVMCIATMTVCCAIFTACFILCESLYNSFISRNGKAPMQFRWMLLILCCIAWIVTCGFIVSFNVGPMVLLIPSLLFYVIFGCTSLWGLFCLH